MQFPCFTSLILILSLASTRALAVDMVQRPDSQNGNPAPGDSENESTPSAAITSSVSCPTGDAQSRYESCSSSVSSKINDCNDNDAQCACNFIGTGMSCLSSYCPTHTSALCYASALLSSACHLASATQPSVLDPKFTCPAGLKSMSIPSSIQGILTSIGAEHSSQTRIATIGTSYTMRAPSSTAAAPKMNVMGMGGLAMVGFAGAVL